VKKLLDVDSPHLYHFHFHRLILDEGHGQPASALFGNTLCCPCCIFFCFLCRCYPRLSFSCLCLPHLCLPPPLCSFPPLLRAERWEHGREPKAYS
jgi:hypothetical protein